ncbi:MAG: PHP domain-containing protein [Candidatus Hydrogenedentes bacterium]|nr:PHP domain-containing protein [Candidatus Hydrogenedentota bacterium]
MKTTFEIERNHDNLINSFNLEERKNSFIKLLEKCRVSSYFEETQNILLFNLHCHSFFSYNGYNLSPTGLVWNAIKNNLYAIGLVDFDVLDGVEEFLECCEKANIRGCAGFETRVFIPQFAKYQINSPGEVGICYHIGMGFTSQKVRKLETLKKLKSIAQSRIKNIIELVNSFLYPLTIDCEKDVIPLTPAGNPTERHLCVAFLEKSKMVYAKQEEFLKFWSEKLGTPISELEKVTEDNNSFQNLIRSKLMKLGGPGYIKPEPETFPTLNEVNEFILANGGIPTFAWLDGTSDGEQKIEELLTLMTASGVHAVNIIPERNWNIKDPELKKVKLQNLEKFIMVAKELYFPIFIGTELNAPGQKFVDNLDCPELRPYYQLFLDGVHIAYAHTILQRIKGMGFTSPWSLSYFSTPKERYEFFKEIGTKLKP